MFVTFRFSERAYTLIFSILKGKTTSSKIKVSFPNPTSDYRLIEHIETKHPHQALKLARMAPERLAMIRSQIPHDQGPE
jgi:hypothetical protein